MADIYGSHFEYAGVLSRKYGMIFANAESERFRKLSGDMKGIHVFNKKINKRYIINNDYSESPISYELDILTEDGHTLNTFERREVEKWLFNKSGYRKLYIDMADDCYSETTELSQEGKQLRLYLNCRFINPERLEYNGGVVGYRATLEADSGLWWQDTTSVSATFDSYDNTHNSSITVSVDTDLDDYTYPKIRVSTGNLGGRLSIINMTTDARNLLITNAPANDTCIIDCGLNKANFVNSAADVMFSTYNFTRLVDGDNTIFISGNVVGITVEYNNRRFL